MRLTSNVVLKKKYPLRIQHYIIYLKKKQVNPPLKVWLLTFSNRDRIDLSKKKEHILISGSDLGMASTSVIRTTNFATHIESVNRYLAIENDSDTYDTTLTTPEKEKDEKHTLLSIDFDFDPGDVQPAPSLTECIFYYLWIEPDVPEAKVKTLQ